MRIQSIGPSVCSDYGMWCCPTFVLVELHTQVQHAMEARLTLAQRPSSGQCTVTTELPQYHCRLDPVKRVDILLTLRDHCVQSRSIICCSVHHPYSLKIRPVLHTTVHPRGGRSPSLYWSRCGHWNSHCCGYSSPLGDHYTTCTSICTQQTKSSRPPRHKPATRITTSIPMGQVITFLRTGLNSA